MASESRKRAGEDTFRQGEERNGGEDSGKRRRRCGPESLGDGDNATTTLTTPYGHQSAGVRNLVSASSVSVINETGEDARRGPLGAHEDAVSLEGTPCRGEQLICYGMVPQIKCQRLGAENEAVFTVEEDAPEYMSLTIDVRRGRLVVGSPAVPELAHMNAKATFVLLEALKFGVELRLFVERKAMRTFLRSDDDTERSQFLNVDANVLGSRSALEDVGTLLSKHNVYLQDPHCPDGTFEYSNPHVMDLGVSPIDIYLHELTMDPAMKGNKSSDNSDWNVVLDDLTQQNKFDATAVKVNSIVMTSSIMPHQGEALDFMCKREIGGSLLDDEMRFWQLDRNEAGAPVYRHTITADEQHKSQPEPQGGILADDMGLGKTFSSISLIACSLERASHFALEIPNAVARGNDALPRSRATLVVVPSTQLMDSWIKELEKHTCPGTLKISKYHGHDRVRDFSDLLAHDIVLTTYGTIATEFRKPRRQVLYHLKFFRIILDEAHTIRSRHTKLFQAVTTLDAAHHWCLTGTPISNGVDDLGALLDFCRVPLLGDSKCFQQHITSVARKSVRRGCSVLRDTLKPLCLRRTRALLKIAQPISIEKEVELSKAEHRQYQGILRRSRKAIDDAVSGRTGKASKHVMLKVLLELRIFCNQGTFTPENLENLEDALDADEKLTLMEQHEEANCNVCCATIAMINQLDDPTSGALGRCSHALCRTCFDGVFQDDSQSAEYTCPVCEDSTELERLQPNAGIDQVSRTSEPQSSKLDALTEDLLRSQDSQAPEKSIVFSDWRKTLNIAADLCKQRGIRHVRIDGKTPQSERTSILHQFTSDLSISTLLMTMGTGALGLNITAASRIHILEPQWNPAVEDQAIGRAVRLGQAKDATVIRYIVKDSVEKQIQGYQRRKMRLAAGGFEQNHETVAAEENVRLNAAFLARA